jgi:hypothetical protein
MNLYKEAILMDFDGFKFSILCHFVLSGGGTVSLERGLM